MTVFNAFLRVIRRNIGTIILYTAIVLIFAAANSGADNGNTGFSGEKPDIMVINLDNDSILSKGFVSYLDENTVLKDIQGGDEAVSDALFYREISSLITIPKGFEKDILSGKTAQVEISSPGTASSELTKMTVQRYLRALYTFADKYDDPEILVSKAEDALAGKTEVTLITKLDTNSLSKVSSYFNFAAYSLMSCIMFIICLVLSSFNIPEVRKRTIVSSMSYKKFNLHLILSCFCYALAVWIFFMLLGRIMAGEIVFTARGAAFIINSLVFTACVLALAFLFSTLLKEKNAVTGIINVVTLGCSFLCGVFVPAEFLPSWVLTAAHALPTYWYVENNNFLSATESLRSNLNHYVINLSVLTGFTILFALAGPIVSGLKRRE